MPCMSCTLDTSHFLMIWERIRVMVSCIYQFYFGPSAIPKIARFIHRLFQHFLEAKCRWRRVATIFTFTRSVKGDKISSLARHNISTNIVWQYSRFESASTATLQATNVLLERETNTWHAMANIHAMSLFSYHKPHLSNNSLCRRWIIFTGNSKPFCHVRNEHVPWRIVMFGKRFTQKL